MNGPDSTRNPFAVRFGLNLARARQAAGVSQELLGDLSTLHRTAVGQLERVERIPRADTLVKLAACLKVSYDDLLVGIRWEPSDIRWGRFLVPEEDRD